MSFTATGYMECGAEVTLTSTSFGGLREAISATFSGEEKVRLLSETEQRMTHIRCSFPRPTQKDPWYNGFGWDLPGTVTWHPKGCLWATAAYGDDGMWASLDPKDFILVTFDEDGGLTLKEALREVAIQGWIEAYEGEAGVLAYIAKYMGGADEA